MNPFTKYKATERTLKVKALNASVKLKSLSLSESKRVDEILYRNGFKDGEANFTMDDITEAKLLKVSLSLVEPEMSVTDLKELPAEAMEAIDEIATAINEGNQKS